MLTAEIFYTESVQQLIIFRLHFHQMAFSKEDKIFAKNLLQQLKCYTASLPVFLENSELKTGQEHKFWQFCNELLYKLMILLNKPYFGLLYAN